MADRKDTNNAAMVKPFLVFGFTILAGTLVWIASPFITGHEEPWDSRLFFLEAGLFISGFIAGLLIPRRCWLWAVGILVGQIIGFFWCMVAAGGDGPLMLVGLLFFLPLYSLWGLAGSYCGAGVNSLCRRYLVEKKSE